MCTSAERTSSSEVDVILDAVLKNEVTRSVQKTGRRWSPVMEKAVGVSGPLGVELYLLRFWHSSVRSASSSVYLLLSGECVREDLLGVFICSYESVIHEFDPYFNYRTTEYLSREGFYEFWNWFDNGSW